MEILAASAGTFDVTAKPKLSRTQTFFSVILFTHKTPDVSYFQVTCLFFHQKFREKL